MARHRLHLIQVVDSRICELLLFQAGISRRSLARDLGFNHLSITRTINNTPGVSREKRSAVIAALSERLKMPVELLLDSGLRVKPEEKT